LLFPVDEIEKNDADGQFFAKLGKARADFRRAVKEAADEIRKPERDKRDRHQRYAERLSTLLGVEIAIPKTRPLGGPEYIAYDVHDRKKADEIIDRLVPVRNRSGLTKDTFPLMNVFGAVAFDTEAIDAYDQKHGQGALFKKLESVQEELQTAVNPKEPQRQTAQTRDQAEKKIESRNDDEKREKVDVPGPTDTGSRPKQRAFSEILAANTGLGVLALIGALVGNYLGGTIGALLGLLVGGGTGACLDGENGVFGIGGATANSAAATPRQAIVSATTPGRDREGHARQLHADGSRITLAHSDPDDPTTGVSSPRKMNAIQDVQVTFMDPEPPTGLPRQSQRHRAIV
jgi:hypothetical protein